jgi:tRNA(Ile)-lysidine synthase
MILPRFRTMIARHRLMERGMKVLVGVSGGPDSVCLLHLLLEIREREDLELEVGHFNHGLRGRQADRDAEFVRDLARRARLRFHLGRATPSAATLKKGESRQEAARSERLSFFLKRASKSGCRRIAFGHNADDLAETMVMRFLAGTGPPGLGGIPPASHGGVVIHPLLAIGRGEIEGYLKKRTIAFRIDPTNLRPRYLRNRVRLELLPLLTRGYNPRLIARLGELASFLRRDNDCLEELARSVLDRSRRQGGKITFPAALRDDTSPALLSRALLMAMRRLAPEVKDFGSRHLSFLLEETGDPRPRVWNLPGGILAASDRRGLSLMTSEAVPPPTPRFRKKLPVPGTAVLPAALGKITARVRKKSPAFAPGELTGQPQLTALDWETVRPPLTIRNRQPGDRFWPLGLPGPKKLKEFLIDLKVPRAARDSLPLVCDRDGIIWVAGTRPSHRCRVTPATRKLLLLRAKLNLKG